MLRSIVTLRSELRGELRADQRGELRVDQRGELRGGLRGALRGLIRAPASDSPELSVLWLRMR